VPESIAAENVNSHVRLDPESYEKADTLPGIPARLPPISENMIPESGLPIVGAGHVAAINTVTPLATTAALAARVPLEEPKVAEEETQAPVGEPEAPGIAEESQEHAAVDPEEVKETERAEGELLEKAPEVPATSEGTSGGSPETTDGDKVIAEAVAAAAATGVATEDEVVERADVAAPDAAAKLPEPVKEALAVPVQETANGTTKEAAVEEVSPEVPAGVRESIQEAGGSPEAAASTEAVEEKKEVEAELLKEVKPVEPAAESSSKVETNGPGTAAPKEPETPAEVATPTTAESTASTSKAAEAPSTTEKKKKSRLSSLFGKIKHKISSKDKA